MTGELAQRHFKGQQDSFIIWHVLPEKATNKKNKDKTHQVIGQIVDTYTTLKIHIQYCAD